MNLQTLLNASKTSTHGWIIILLAAGLVFVDDEKIQKKVEAALGIVVGSGLIQAGDAKKNRRGEKTPPAPEGAK